jgi:GNAT superfamily N-acetyltransferase
MERRLTNEIATAYWAAHFGIPCETLFSEPLKIIRHSDELADYGGVFALFREGSRVVSLPLERAEALRPILSELPAGFCPEDLGRALQPIASAVIGPAFIGYADGIASPSHGARALTIDDANAVFALRDACSEIEWEHGGCGVCENPASGVFIDQRLVALAQYEVWGDTIAHICVITHPEYRGCGFGTAAVAHLSARAFANGLLPQYRTLDANDASMRIATRLGFVRYATSMAIRLNP